MRILLTSNAAHVPPRGGSTRSNLLWLEHMAAQGHECVVVAATAEHDTAAKRQQVLTELEQQHLGALGAEQAPGVHVQMQHGLRIYSVQEPARRTQVLRGQISAWQPDWVLVSSEDLSHVLLREAHHSAPDRVVYLVHTPQFYPFGPASWNRDADATQLVSRSAGIVAISHAMAEYVQQHTGQQAEVIHPPMYGVPPYPDFHRFGQGFITLINPCQVKGITILQAVTQQMPEVTFAALPGWGTTRADRAALEALPNVTVLPHAPHIDDVLRRTRILLVPSLWLEGFGLVVMEAMLRGIPVVASDYGGLRESKHGTSYTIPINPIEQYTTQFDERNMPEPVLPPQDVQPWIEAVRHLTTDASAYEEEAERSRQAALRFVGSLHAGDLEKWLGQLSKAAMASQTQQLVETGDSRLQALSAERRALLLRQLKRGTPL